MMIITVLSIVVARNRRVGLVFEGSFYLIGQITKGIFPVLGLCLCLDIA